MLREDQSEGRRIRFANAQLKDCGGVLTISAVQYQVCEFTVRQIVVRRGPLGDACVHGANHLFDRVCETHRLDEDNAIAFKTCADHVGRRAAQCSHLMRRQRLLSARRDRHSVLCAALLRCIGRSACVEPCDVELVACLWCGNESSRRSRTTLFIAYRGLPRHTLGAKGSITYPVLLGSLLRAEGGPPSTTESKCGWEQAVHPAQHSAAKRVSHEQTDDECILSPLQWHPFFSTVPDNGC